MLELVLSAMVDDAKSIKRRHKREARRSEALQEHDAKISADPGIDRRARTLCVGCDRTMSEPRRFADELRVYITRGELVVTVTVEADDHCLIHRTLPATGQTADSVFATIVLLDGERIERVAADLGVQVYSASRSMSSALNRRDLCHA